MVKNQVLIGFTINVVVNVGETAICSVISDLQKKIDRNEANQDSHITHACPFIRL